MRFDLRPYLKLDPAESQITEGGADLFENCTWAALADTLYDYGYGDPLSPQQMREVVNPGWHGGEPWSASLNLVSQRPDLYPSPPLMLVEYPADVVDTMRFYGSQGMMVHWAGWCTPDAHWLTSQPANGISHAGRIVYADDDAMALWNVWTGYLVRQPDDFWRASYDGGGILVFHRALWERPMTDDEVRAVFDILYSVHCGRYPDDADRAEIERRWLLAWKENPRKARYDFGIAAAGEDSPPADVGVVRKVDLEAALAKLAVSNGGLDTHKHMTPLDVAGTTVSLESGPPERPGP